MKRFINNKKALSLLIATILISLPVFKVVSATGWGEVYPKDFTIKNLLTDFQYVVEEDLIGTSAGHVIGSVVVGQNLEVQNAVADIRHAPSYVNHIVYI